jgi:hypothetical protein
MAWSLKFAFACGLESRKFSAKSIAPTTELVRFLLLVVVTFRKGTNMAVFGRSAQLHAQMTTPATSNLHAQTTPVAAASE